MQHAGPQIDADGVVAAQRALWDPATKACAGVDQAHQLVRNPAAPRRAPCAPCCWAISPLTSPCRPAAGKAAQQLQRQVARIEPPGRALGHGSGPRQQDGGPAPAASRPRRARPARAPRGPGSGSAARSTAGRPPAARRRSRGRRRRPGCRRARPSCRRACDPTARPAGAAPGCRRPGSSRSTQDAGEGGAVVVHQPARRTGRRTGLPRSSAVLWRVEVDDAAIGLQGGGRRRRSSRPSAGRRRRPAGPRPDALWV